MELLGYGFTFGLIKVENLFRCYYEFEYNYIPVIFFF